MPRVRMFCDWDNDSIELVHRLRNQTGDWHAGTKYHDIQFVEDNSYDYAVVFDYVVSHPGTPTVSLILEPPEIIAAHENPPDIPTYSFCDNGIHTSVYGLGFATVPKHHPVKLGERSHQICMIVSSKTLTPYHTRRHEIKDALLASDIEVDFYGRNLTGRDRRIMGEIGPMEKQYVLDHYKFVIDFENTARNAVTDKFFDAALCGTVPVTNSVWLRDNYPDSVEFIDFDWPIEQIVDKVRELSIDARAAEYDRATTRNDILTGKLCLAKWIEERLEEL